MAREPMWRGETMRRLAPVGAVLLGLAAASAAANAAEGTRAGEGDPPKPVAEVERAADSGLRGFPSCGALRRFGRRHSDARSAPLGITEGGPPLAGSPAPTAPPQASQGEGAGSGAADSSSSPTNVQEPGIDEPDIVKADGSTAFALAAGELRSIAISGEALSELDSIKLSELPGSAANGHSHQLLLVGDRLLLITEASAGSGGEADAPQPLSYSYYDEPRTILTEVDASDPGALSVAGTMRVEGDFVSARLAGETARIVVSSFPEFPTPSPPSGTPVGRRDRNLVPYVVVRDDLGGAAAKRRLVGCQEVRRPRSFSGLEMLSVLTIDVPSGLDPVDVDSIMTRGQTVYSSAEALYVATERWLDVDATERQLSAVTTGIHKFALESATETAYVASGEVPGFMLNQWALSEADGLLRVASTVDAPNLDIGERESFVTVLSESGGALSPLGQVGGLGRGERIYAVRFIGEIGYVVTFRQVDPLYTVDLSEPTRPRLAGELKVPGYSAYLHPVGEGFLLGVGQDATEQGRRLGAQASLFDVTDLSAPRDLDRHSMGEGSSSEVEQDHHAFLFDPSTGLAVIPMVDYGYDGGEPFAGAVALRVAGGGIDEIARLSHPDAGGAGETVEALPIRRSLVAGERLLTLSERGLMSHDLATLATRTFLRFE